MFTETIIIGGGQAGLSLSYCLKQRDSEHIVLEQGAAIANAWRNNRWDSFTLVSPNWTFNLPGIEYKGDSPDSFMPREEIVRSFDEYIKKYNLPVKCNQKVISVTSDGNSGYQVETEDSGYHCNNVVVATGLYQQPKVPPFSSDISSYIKQITSAQYRNASLLPAGAVLVAGTGQSGCQIAEDLRRAGRKVYLSTGGAGRVPRRYRGKDIFHWLKNIGFVERTADQLPDPVFRFLPNPHLTGANGGSTLNLHKFVQQGVTLLGHITGGEGSKLKFAPDLKMNLEKADKFEADLLLMIDKYIEDNNLDFPAESIEILKDGYNVPEITELDLDSAGISTIIWACGYKFNFDFIKFPVFDQYGYPVQDKLMTAIPGLYFLGLPWLIKHKSGLLIGVGEDAKYLAEKLTSKEKIKNYS